MCPSTNTTRQCSYDSWAWKSQSAHTSPMASSGEISMRDMAPSPVSWLLPNSRLAPVHDQTSTAQRDDSKNHVFVTCCSYKGTTTGRPHIIDTCLCGLNPDRRTAPPIRCIRRLASRCETAVSLHGGCELVSCNEVGSIW